MSEKGRNRNDLTSTSIPTLVFENAVSAFSRLRDWATRRGTYETWACEDVIENKHTSFKLKGILKRGEQQTERHQHRFADAVQEIIDIKKYDGKRRERKRGRIRRGPMPYDELPPSERGPSTPTHATLNPNIQRKEAGHEGDLPSNRGLLTYFARIGTGNQECQVDLGFVQSLLSAGASINIGDRYGQTILHATARDWHTDVARFFISNGGDINVADQFGRTPIHVAAAIDYPQMVQFLVENGANLYARTQGEGQTPLHYAAKFNALQSIKYLLKIGANVSDRDYKERTSLFLAAEHGRREAVEYLLGMGAAAAAYDNGGICAVALMVDKMPDLARLALDQFLIEDKPTRTNYYHLCALEFDTRCKMGKTPARSVLETIVFEEDKDLIQHVAITKLIDVKWKMITKWRAVFDISTNLIHACILTALAVTMNFKGERHPYANLKEEAWKICLEALFLLIAIFFIYKQTMTRYRITKRHEQWKMWRINHMSKDLKYCHPQWPEEKRYLKGEIERVRAMQWSQNNGWTYYEWIATLGVICIVILQTLYAFKPSGQIGMALKFIYLIELFLVWLRLLRPMKSVPIMSGLIVMLVDIAKGSIQFLYIFMEFYIPIAVAFYIMFGGEENIAIMKAQGNSADSIANYETFQQMMFSIFWVVIGGSFDPEPLLSVDRTTAEIMVSLLFAILKLVAANLFISLMSYLFGRVYNKARATALLQSANYILMAERNLSTKQSGKFRKTLRQDCNPLETYETGLLTKEEEENEMETDVKDINENIEKLLKAISRDDKKKERQCNDEELHRIRLTFENLSDIEKIQSKAEQIFDEKWQKVVENQRAINELLKKPEVKEHILKTVPKRTERRASSLSR